MRHQELIQKNYYLFHIFAIIIALSLFVAGRFGFFDILGMKRIVEAMLFIPIGILGSLLILKVPRLWLNPFFLLPLAYFIFQLFWYPDRLELADLGISVLIVATILSLGPSFSDLLLRYAIKISTFFAFLGLLEFLILLIDPSLAHDTLLFYDSYSGSTVPVIEHALQLLGLSDGTSYHLWGMAVTRLRSFTSEPSLLVGYFLVPGALGLTYGGKYTLYGIACIFFCICSFAGSVYVALALSSLGILVLMVRRPRFAVILPFMILAIFFWVLYTHYTELVLLSKSSNGGYDFLDKTNSANMRFSYIRDFLPKVVTSPFGLDEEIYQPLGFIVRSTARSGAFGLVFSLLIICQLYANIGFVLIRGHLRWLQKIGICIIYGALITGLIYLDNCFLQIYGFTLLVLINDRLLQMRAIR